MVIIKCKQCSIDKPEWSYGIFRGRRNKTCFECRDRNNKWYKENKDNRKTKAKVYYQRTKHKVAQYRSDLRLDRKYSLTREQWNEMLAKQNGLCGICNKSMAKPCVDHNHENGKVRGLLHRQCNLDLQVLENKDFVINAQKYLDSMK